MHSFFTKATLATGLILASTFIEDAEAAPITQTLDLSGTPISLGTFFTETASNGTDVDISTSLGAFERNTDGVINLNGFGNFELTFSDDVDNVFITASLEEGFFTGNNDITFSSDVQTATFTFSNFNTPTTFDVTSALGAISTSSNLEFVSFDTGRITLHEMTFTTNDSVTPVPLPAAGFLLGAGLAGFAAARRFELI